MGGRNLIQARVLRADNFTELKNLAHDFYFKKLKHFGVQCSLFPGREIRFTRTGWRHMNVPDRTRGQILSKLICLPFVPEVLTGATEIEETRKEGAYTYYELCGWQVRHKVSVILSEYKNELYFLSVFRKKRKRQSK